MTRATELLFVLLLCLPSLACDEEGEVPRDAPEPSSEDELPEERDWSSFPPVDLDAIEELEVFHTKSLESGSFPRVPVEYGPTVYRGKWLGFTGGHNYFLGEDHIIVNHFERAPKDYYTDPLEKSVLLNVRTGEVSATFLRHIEANYRRGLALVEGLDGSGVHLLDAQTGSMVPVLPEGDHDYVYEKNYWIHLGAVEDRVWVYAVDDEEVVHLFEWEDISKPPPLPDAPFPFFPEEWARTWGGEPDFEEVSGMSAPEECRKALLQPPRGYECLEGSVASSDPLSGGWRFSSFRGDIFNYDDGRGMNVNNLCPDAKWGVTLKAISARPPKVSACCEENCWVWTPDAVYRPAGGVSEFIAQTPHSLAFHEETQVYDIFDYGDDRLALSVRYGHTYRARVVGEYRCAHLRYGLDDALRILSIACHPTEWGSNSWVEIVDKVAGVRSERFEAPVIVMGHDGVGVVIRGEPSAQSVQTVQLAHF